MSTVYRRIYNIIWYQIQHKFIIEKLSWKYVFVITICIHFIEYEFQSSVFATYIIFNQIWGKKHQILHQPIIEKVSWKYVSVIAIDIHFIEFSVFAIYMLFNKMLDGFSVALGS